MAVVWTEDGWKVDLKVYGWKNTMEDAVCLNKLFEREEGMRDEGSEPGHENRAV